MFNLKFGSFMMAVLTFFASLILVGCQANGDSSQKKNIDSRSTLSKKAEAVTNNFKTCRTNSSDVVGRLMNCTLQSVIKTTINSEN